MPSVGLGIRWMLGCVSTAAQLCPPECPTCREATLRLAGPGNQEGVGRLRDRRVLPTTYFGELV